MLSGVLKKYEINKRNNIKQIETLHDQIEEEIESTTILSLKIQNHKISRIHSNQQSIEKKLQVNTQLQSELRNHSNAWSSIYNSLNNALKDAGDVVNYAKYVGEEIRQMSSIVNQRSVDGETGHKEQQERVDKPEQLHQKQGEQQQINERDTATKSETTTIIN